MGSVLYSVEGLLVEFIDIVTWQSRIVGARLMEAIFEDCAGHGDEICTCKSSTAGSP